jgi:hypothetical protein
MPAILVTIISWALASLVARVLVGAGLTLATYSGIDSLIDNMLDGVTASFGLLGDSAQILYIAGVGEAVSIIGGAIVASATMYAAQVFLLRAS